MGSEKKQPHQQIPLNPTDKQSRYFTNQPPRTRYAQTPKYATLTPSALPKSAGDLSVGEGKEEEVEDHHPSELTFTKLHLDFKSTWFPILILFGVVLGIMISVSVYLNAINPHGEVQLGHHEHDHDHDSGSDDNETYRHHENDGDRVQIRDKGGSNVVSTRHDAGNHARAHEDTDTRDMDWHYTFDVRFIVIYLTMFAAISVCLVCVSFEFGKPLELWLLATPWCIWVIFGTFTISGGLSVNDTISSIASCVAVVSIMCTYHHFVKSRKTVVLIVILICIAAILFFPHDGSNAFVIDVVGMVTHLITFFFTFVIVGYFDALIVERSFKCDDTAHYAVRVLRVGWVLFVETRLLFFLGLQIFIAILNLNYVNNMNQLSSNTTPEISVIGSLQGGVEGDVVTVNGTGQYQFSHNTSSMRSTDARQSKRQDFPIVGYNLVQNEYGSGQISRQ